MKKLVVSVVFVLAISAGLAQTSQNPFSKASLSLDEKSWFQESGFPVAQYDFDSTEINNQLKNALQENKKGKTLNTIGWIGVGVGFLASVIPSGSSSGGVGAKTYAGIGVSIGGFALTLVGNGKKRKAKRRVENATYLYNSSL